MDAFTGEDQIDMDDLVNRMLLNLVESRAALQTVVAGAANAIGQGLTQADQGLTQVSRALTRKVGNGVRSVQQQMDPVVQSLQTQATAAVGETGAQLGMAQSGLVQNAAQIEAYNAAHQGQFAGGAFGQSPPPPSGGGSANAAQIEAYNAAHQGRYAGGAYGQSSAPPPPPGAGNASQIEAYNATHQGRFAGGAFTAQQDTTGVGQGGGSTLGTAAGVVQYPPGTFPVPPTGCPAGYTVSPYIDQSGVTHMVCMPFGSTLAGNLQGGGGGGTVPTMPGPLPIGKPLQPGGGGALPTGQFPLGKPLLPLPPAPGDGFGTGSTITGSLTSGGYSFPTNNGTGLFFPRLRLPTGNILPIRKPLGPGDTQPLPIRKPLGPGDTQPLPTFPPGRPGGQPVRPGGGGTVPTLPGGTAPTVPLPTFPPGRPGRPPGRPGSPPGPLPTFPPGRPPRRPPRPGVPPIPGSPPPPPGTQPTSPPGTPGGGGGGGGNGTQTGTTPTGGTGGGVLSFPPSPGGGTGGTGGVGGTGGTGGTGGSGACTINVQCAPCLGGGAPQPAPPPPPSSARVSPFSDERPDDADVARGVCTTGQPLITVPLPGSAEWCRLAPEIALTLERVGEQLFQWLSSDVQNLMELAITISEAPPPSGGFLSIGFDALLGGLLRMLARLARPALKTIWDALCRLKNGLIGIEKCSTQGYLFLCLTRALFRILKRVQLGTDAVLWATLDVDIDFPAWELVLDYLVEQACPVEIPTPPDAIEAWLSNQIDDQTLHCWMAMNGCDDRIWQAVIAARREQLTAEELIEYGRRYNFDDDQLAHSLRYLGWIKDFEAKARVELYDEIPGIADHLHWLQRNVFDDKYVQDFGLMEGFEERFWAKFGKDLRTKGMKKEYAALHYAAHWLNPAMGQAFEMMQRLRPGRVPKDVEFTEANMLRLMAEMDVAPYFRERFRQIAYRTFSLRFMKQIWDAHGMDAAEYKQRWMDLGYKGTDADIMVSAEEIRRNRTVETQVNGYTVKNVRTLYLANKLRPQEVIDYLARVGYDAETARRAMAAWRAIDDAKQQDQGGKAARAATIRAAVEGLKVGVLTDQQAQAVFVQAGFSSANAAAYAGALMTSDRIDLVKSAVSAIKKGVLHGSLPIDDAPALLSHLGIRQVKIDDYIALWRDEAEGDKKVLTASQIVRKAGQGRIPLDVARQRLLNMGYGDPDDLLLLSDAQQQLADTERKAIETQDKARTTQAKELQRLIDQNKKQLERMRKQLAALGSPSKLAGWYREGLIGPLYYRQRLEALGYSDTDITLVIEEADMKGAVKSGKTPIAPTNPGVRPAPATPGSAGT